MQSSGLDVLLWTAPEDQRERIMQAGVELAPQDLLSTAAAQGVRLEDITSIPEPREYSPEELKEAYALAKAAFTCSAVNFWKSSFTVFSAAKSRFRKSL